MFLGVTVFSIVRSSELPTLDLLILSDSSGDFRFAFPTQSTILVSEVCVASA
jgi:hypothetical protein